MKSLYIPTAVLAGIVALSLWCGAYVGGRTETWVSMLEETDEAAWREDWQTATQHLDRAYGSWQREQTLLHTLASHDELEQAESLFAGAFAACREMDGPDFHTMLAQLTAALRHLAEGQAVSVKNIF